VLEQRFERVHQRATHAGWIEVDGGSWVVVSAPHAVPHLREGVRKGRDTYTGPLAMALASATGCRAIVAAKRVGADPNAGPTPYGDRLVELASGAIVLDLHGAAARPGMDVGLGTGGGRTLAGRRDVLDAVVTVLAANDLHVEVDPPGFAAHGAERLAQVLASAGTTAIQVEVSEDLRAPLVRPAAWERVVEALSAAVRALRELA
jgi:hypothetical protein